MQAALRRRFFPPLGGEAGSGVSFKSIHGGFRLSRNDAGCGKVTKKGENMISRAICCLVRGRRVALVASGSSSAGHRMNKSSIRFRSLTSIEIVGASHQRTKSKLLQQNPSLAKASGIGDLAIGKRQSVRIAYGPA
jgi:hypothetical protein